MPHYYHALDVVPDRCQGHLTCVRVCPTQAIRHRNGRIAISEELCVDCGLCVTVCPRSAIVPVGDSLNSLDGFKYKVLVPSPVLYSQFEPGVHPHIVREACRRVGFDAVVDGGALSAQIVQAIILFMRGYQGRLPLISSHCPAVLRLVQVKYPDLVELLIPVDVPREITAMEIRRDYPARLGLRREEIGIIYATPCPAKTVSIKQPAEKERSWFDGAVSIRDLYCAIVPHVMALRETFESRQVPADFTFHSGWATVGGITRAVEMENWLAVSGLDHVMRIFDDIENSRLRNIDFVEAMACMLGCVGGPFNVENPFVARGNSIKQYRRYGTPHDPDLQAVAEQYRQGYFFFKNPVRPRPTKYFDTDLETSIKRMRERERVYKKLPQKDCSLCGAPTCMAFAEDFVRREVEITDCIYLAHTMGHEPRKSIAVEPAGKNTP